MSKEWVLNQLQEHLKEYQSNFKQDWIGIFLFGSQNYGLDDEYSDVDSRILVNYHSSLFYKTMDFMRPNGEHVELIDSKDFFLNLRRMDIQALEILFTEYKIINPKYKKLWEQLECHKEIFAHLNEALWVVQMRGQLMLNKERFILQETADPLATKIGYAPKGAYHMARQVESIEKYCEGLSYSEVLHTEQRELLLNIKRGGFTQSECLSLLQQYEQKGLFLLDSYVPKKVSLLQEYELFKLTQLF